MIVITLAFCLFIYLLYLQTPSLIMSGAPKSRGMFQYVFKHFWDSFKVGKRQKVGNLMGKVIQWMKFAVLCAWSYVFLSGSVW